MKKEIYESRPLHTSQIYADDYQRPIDQKRVDNIVEHFDARLVNPIKVSYRNGKFWVFDGQHTMAALKKLNGGKDLNVKCLVFYNLTKQDEAELFAQGNGISKPVNIGNRLRALVIAKDEKALKFVELIKRAGFSIDFTSAPAPNKISAVGKAYKIYQTTTCSEFSLILRIIKRAWNGKTESLKPEILGGMYELLRVHAVEINFDTLISKLSNAIPREIIRNGKGIVHGGDKRFANQMIYIYNKGLKSKRLCEISLMGGR